ncbi:MAG: DNA/RNA nuclease SfsA [Candidatus Methanoplasma sp.]|jgi:sugar fermentation stimulation protein A|nr:DNA/RNA nuclease SfsA [Candidatus Methanoplasma sp.]
MIYPDIRRGVFLERPNRFAALVDVDGEVERCHVCNTGRCAELLVPGAEAILSASSNPARSTRYGLVSVYKGGSLVNIDSMAPNRVALESFDKIDGLGGMETVRREHAWGGSRFDFYAEGGGRRALVEVKGVTLERGGVAMFPDAPTERGLRHVRELERALSHGFEATVVFVIQMGGARRLVPNREAHGEFADAVESAAEAGVRFLAYGCDVSEGSVALGERVPVEAGGRLI